MKSELTWVVNNDFRLLVSSNLNERPLDDLPVVSRAFKYLFNFNHDITDTQIHDTKTLETNSALQGNFPSEARRIGYFLMVLRLYEIWWTKVQKKPLKQVPM